MTDRAATEGLKDERLRSVPGRQSPPGDPLAARLDPEPRSEVARAAEEPAAAAIVPDARALVRTEDDGWLGRLAGGVVHELKNPLSTIHLNLELLRDEWGRAWATSTDPRERRSLKRLDVVLRETRRLDAMLRDFLRFTRADRIRRAPTDLAGLVEEVLAFVAPECALRGIQVRREYEAGLGEVAVDPDLVKQAVLNLVQNAQDAMTAREAGDEEPGSGSGTGTRPELTVRVARAEGGVAIAVTDTGVGIAADEMPHLFELYRTTKPDGTGLGLATTKRIAEVHGGRIDVESEVSRGSRFTIVLPDTHEAHADTHPELV